MRLLHPLAKDPVEETPPALPDRLPDILQAMVDILKRDQPTPPAVDLAPVVEAIRALPQPVPAPVKSWTFTMKRDDYGVLTEVVATKRM